MDTWYLNEEDLTKVEEIRSFVPLKLFDIHAHIYRTEDLNVAAEDNHFSSNSKEISINRWLEFQGNIFQNKRLHGGLFSPTATLRVNKEDANRYLIDQVNEHFNSRGLILVHPHDSDEKISKYLSEKKVIGMKPSHVFSDKIPIWNSGVCDLLPERFWQIANDNHSIIMLHIVKQNEIKDKQNQEEIIRLCTKYTKVKLILVYCAGTFHGLSITDITALRGLENVWFDTSAICEPESLEKILYEFGPKKLLWGSGFPISEIRGKPITIGNEFAWIQLGELINKDLFSHDNPILIGIESILALKKASENFGLNNEDIKNIFYNNALQITGINSGKKNKTNRLYDYAKTIIPGGTQLLSKRPEMQAPNKWPAYFAEARGCEVWDLDDNHYYDMSTNGIGSCLLGFRDDDVTKAVKRRINLGSMSSLNPPEEVELSKMLVDLHPWANQVRFTRTGGEATSVATRIARATTGKEIIVVCGYHGWHDWYLAANLGETDQLSGHLLPGLNPKGVPRQLNGTTVAFNYNDREALQRIFDEHGSNIAAIIMEPCRNNNPEKGFLEFVRDISNNNNTQLIFDEITIGFRLGKAGAHLEFDIIPDMAIYAKALGNGHPIAAIVGTEDSMEGANESFISSTYWTESVGPTAAIATLKKLKEVDAPTHINKVGREIKDAWEYYGRINNLPLKVDDGFSCFSKFSFEHENSLILQTIYTRKMLERGFLAGTSIYPTLAHTESIVQLYKNAIREVFSEISDYLNHSVEYYIEDSDIAHTGFKRLL